MSAAWINRKDAKGGPANRSMSDANVGTTSAPSQNGQSETSGRVRRTRRTSSLDPGADARPRHARVRLRCAPIACAPRTSPGRAPGTVSRAPPSARGVRELWGERLPLARYPFRVLDRIVRPRSPFAVARPFHEGGSLDRRRDRKSMFHGFCNEDRHSPLPVGRAVRNGRRDAPWVGARCAGSYPATSAIRLAMRFAAALTGSFAR